MRRDLDHPPGKQAVDQPAGVVDQVEPAILADALLGQLDLGRVLEGEPLDRSNRQAATVGTLGCYRTTMSRNCSVDGSSNSVTSTTTSTVTGSGPSNGSR